MSEVQLWVRIIMADVMYYDESVIFDVDDPDFTDTGDVDQERANTNTKMGECFPSWFMFEDF